MRGIGRRVGARRGLGTRRASALDSFLSLFQSGDFRFDAASFSVDGVSGKVSGFVDRLDASHSLVQATSSRQVATPVADAGMGGQMVASFVEASVHRYQGNKTAAEYAFLHGSSGVSAYTLFSPGSGTNSVVWGTRNNVAAAETGAALARAGVQLGRSIGNGTATQPIAYATIPSVNIANDAVVLVSISHGTAGSPQYSLSVNGVQFTSAPYASAPSSGNPTYALTLGAKPDGSAAPTMRWGALWVFKRLHTSAEEAVVLAYAKSAYGVP